MHRKTKNNIDINFNSKEFVYTLGYIWADGHVNKKINAVVITSVSKDMDLIQHIFQKTYNNLRRFDKKREKNWQLVSTVRFGCSQFARFLRDNDYRNKKEATPIKILSQIPTQLHKYFWRGVFDGDGTIRIRKSKYSAGCEIGICSNYLQDWSSLVNFLNRIGIEKFTLRKEISKRGHKCSRIILNNILDCLTFLSALYGEDDKIYLPRKYNEFIQIKNYAKYMVNRYLWCCTRQVNKSSIKYHATFYENRIRYHIRSFDNEEKTIEEKFNKMKEIKSYLFKISQQLGVLDFPSLKLLLNK